MKAHARRENRTFPNPTRLSARYRSRLVYSPINISRGG